jgi:hypothetical protein
LTVKGESIARQLDVEPRAPCCKCHSGNVCRVTPESKSPELCATDSNDSKISPVPEHDPEKWKPVFGKDHAQIRN